jgi:hypothetical protein
MALKYIELEKNFAYVKPDMIKVPNIRSLRVSTKFSSYPTKGI